MTALSATDVALYFLVAAAAGAVVGFICEYATALSPASIREPPVQPSPAPTQPTGGDGLLGALVGLALLGALFRGRGRR